MKNFRFSLGLVVLTLGIALFMVPVAQAQSTALAGSTVLMSLKGKTMGNLLGEVTQKGREGKHAIHAYSHEIVAPRDPATGLPTGKRQHQPFRVVKMLNQSSPLLLTALSRSEVFTTVTIDVWSTASAATGVEARVLTYTLTNARLVSIRPWMPNKQDTTVATYSPAEELAFVYESITETFWSGGIEGTDTWE